MSRAWTSGTRDVDNSEKRGAKTVGSGRDWELLGPRSTPGQERASHPGGTNGCLCICKSTAVRRALSQPFVNVKAPARIHGNPPAARRGPGTLRLAWLPPATLERPGDARALRGYGLPATDAGGRRALEDEHPWNLSRGRDVDRKTEDAHFLGDSETRD